MARTKIFATLFVLIMALLLPSMVVTTIPYWKAYAASPEEEFTRRLTQAQSPKALETLINQYKDYEFVGQAIKKIEKLISESVQSSGAESRFTIKQIASLVKDIPISIITIRVIRAGDKSFTKYETEFDHDSFAYELDTVGSKGKANPFGHGSIHRIVGQINMPYEGYAYLVGEGDKLHRLTFLVDKNLGYIYLRGIGRAVREDGSEIQFGYVGDGPKITAKTTTAPANLRDEYLTFTGTIKKVGSAFDSSGVKLILIDLEEHSKIDFEIPVNYGTQIGFKKILDLYEKQALKATSGMMGTFYKDTGFEGKKVSIGCDKSNKSNKCIVKSLEWKD